jgi:hypothetical protein
MRNYPILAEELLVGLDYFQSSVRGGQAWLSPVLFFGAVCKLHLMYL